MDEELEGRPARRSLKQFVDRFGSVLLFAVGLGVLVVSMGTDFSVPGANRSASSSRPAPPPVSAGPPRAAAPAFESERTADLEAALADRSELDAGPPETWSQPETRRIRFEYTVDVPERLVGSGATHLFIPLAIDTNAQRVLSMEIDSPVRGQSKTELVYGNRFWHAALTEDFLEPFSVRIAYEVERAVLRAGASGNPTIAAAVDVARFLEPNARVVVGDAILDPILEEIRAASPGADKATRARAIYDWVVDNVEYKKVGTGWGNGDTFWACNERYGNCTDFHSLFISLARTEGIPARFEMGFPVPLDRREGEISGYHCWVEFWLPEVGWFPIDASEAFKHPEKRELFYGTHPADRLHFTTGRDLWLGAEHQDQPLNYFIYPYLESDRKRSDLTLESHFTYEIIDDDPQRDPRTG